MRAGREREIRLIQYLGRAPVEPSVQEVARFRELAIKIETREASDEDQGEFLGLLGSVCVDPVPEKEEDMDIRLVRSLTDSSSLE